MVQKYAFSALLEDRKEVYNLFLERTCLIVASSHAAPAHRRSRAGHRRKTLSIDSRPRRAKKRLKIGLWVLLGLLVLSIAAVLTLNFHVVSTGKAALVSSEEAAGYQGDCIVVFGAGVSPSGKLSDMLKDRMDTALALYQAGAAPKLLLSGDHGRNDYNEAGAMRDYALAHGVSEENIFLDHAGFSTYETLYRARDVFGVRRAVLVTQEYHLYRALYVGEKLGLSTVGVSADRHTYLGQWKRELREIAARNKDVFTCLFHLHPTFLGEAIAINGDGRVTWDDAEKV